MSLPQPNLSIVALAYNEEESVRPFLEEALEFLDVQPGEHEIIVVDDGSTDETAALVQEIAEGDPRVRLISHPRNRGMGAGMRTGFRNAEGTHVCILAADGQVSAWELAKLIPHLSSASIVLSQYSRRHSEVFRVGLSKGLRTLMWMLLGTYHSFEGTYLFPASVARDEIGLDSICSETFMFNFELISRAMMLGHSTRFVTIDPKPRAAGSSKVANLARISMVTEDLLRFRAQLFREGHLWGKVWRRK